MNILVLNGSPRPNGNTAKMVTAFREGAESSGHTVKALNVCKLNVKGCLACEYCHTKGNGKCIQKDDMQEIYSLLKDTNMLVLVSPIYYHGISGQLKCVIDRFYSALYPAAPKSLTKIAMFSYKGDFLGYLGLKDMGVFTSAGSVSDDLLAKIRKFGESL